MDLIPKIITTAPLEHGRLDLVEWYWPDMIDFRRTEADLMLEMSLPPHTADASAEFPDIDPGNHCFMGTLFVRYPHVAIHGRGEGGHIRVLRCVFSDASTRTILRGASIPVVAVLQGLLDIRSASLRTMMSLALREMTAQHDHSIDALEAIHQLIAIELRRLLERPLHGSPSGRLAPWQYRRIRERLAMEGSTPTSAELAALCGISTRHLNRQFLALTGSTVADYVTDFWIDRAKVMLAQGDMPINNIASAIGFSHPNSFARAFRRLTGMTPHDFRQSMVGMP